MGVQVRFSPGHDIYYLPGRAHAGGAGEPTAGGYYVNAAQAGEAPGRWFGKGAEALGLAEGSEVDPDVHEKVFSQVDPRTGAQIGSKPPGAATLKALLARLLEMEPHATGARRHELERVAARQCRVAHPYTDFTVSYSKSISVAHASIRENARQAALAGDLAAEAYWADMEARVAGILFDGAMVAMRHLEQWAVTRTGVSRQVADQQFSRYEPAGLITSMWLQGTSRDGDPHDHVHCAITRMCLTLSDGRHRAVDTMALRQQGGTAKLLAAAYHPSAFRRSLGLQWRASAEGAEVNGIAQEHMDAYSSRGEEITRELKKACAEFERTYGRAPNRAEVRRIKEEVWSRTRKRKDDAPIDWDALAARWDGTLGGDLAQIALDLGLGPGGAAQRCTEEGGGPSPVEQIAAMGAALARVQAKHPAWTRGQLCGELADCLPPSMAELAPEPAIALALEMADRIIGGEVQPVACLDAPEPKDARTTPALRRDLDGRSIFTRPGISRYATEVQLSREEKLLARARQEGAPRLSRAKVAGLLRADPAQLDAQLRESVRAEDSRAIRPSGLSVAQQAAAYHVMTSPRRCEPIEAAAGAGKTHVLARIARMCQDAQIPVYGLGPSQTAVNVLRVGAAAAGVQLTAWNTARFLRQLPDGQGYGRPQEIPRGSVLLVDEGSMVSLEHYGRIMKYAAVNGCKVIVAGDRNQLSAVEHGGGFALLADELGVVQLPDPVRFTHEWEQAASLRLRAGDAEVLTEYADQGRITGAPPEQAKDMARRAYVAEYVAGRAPLMMAASNELVDELNDTIRCDLRHLGLAQAGGPEVALMNGRRAGVGDPIVLRNNHHDAESGEPGRGLANGDTLEIVSINGDQVMVRRLLDADANTGQRQYTRPFAFPYAAESQLGHVVTGHRAQGRTVTAGIALFTGAETHEWAYPALTRGWDSNHAIVFTLAPNRADPRPGTREAPELSQWTRMQNERAARDNPAFPDPETADDAQLEALGILSGVLERPERELAASQWKAREKRNADHLGRLYLEWQHLTGEANRARYEAQLRAALPEDLRDTPLTGTATWLWRSLRAAEAAGLDSGQVIADAIGKRSLSGARDIAAVVDARIRKATAGLIPLVPRPWAEQVPEVADPAIRAHLERRAAQMDARTERLAAHVTQTAPTWAVQATGPVPEDPVERLEWQHRIAPVAAYRELFGWDHETEPIGPEPTADTPEKRGAWHGAFAALGPARGLDLRNEPDSRLYLMMSTYGTITQQAPRYVGGELRFIRVAARDFGLRAVRHAAEIKAARERGDEAAAQRHATREASARAMEERARAMEARLATQDEIYREHVRATEYERLIPVAARTELIRRHPDKEIPALRSAEPAPPSKAERAELLWPRLDRQGQIQPEAMSGPQADKAARAEEARRAPLWPRINIQGQLTAEAWATSTRKGPEPRPGAAAAAVKAQRSEPQRVAEIFGRWLDGTKDKAPERQAQRAKPEPERVQVKVQAQAAPMVDKATEPEKRDEPERECQDSHEPPLWLKHAERTAQQAREKLAERETQKMPDEDHEREDIGSAWPGLAEPERDAILQPARPELQAAPEIEGQAAEPEPAYTACTADREAGE